MESCVRDKTVSETSVRHEPRSITVTLQVSPPSGPGRPRGRPADTERADPARALCALCQRSCRQARPHSWLDCPPEPHVSRGSGAATTRQLLIHPCPRGTGPGSKLTRSRVQITVALSDASATTEARTEAYGEHRGRRRLCGERPTGLTGPHARSWDHTVTPRALRSHTRLLN